MVHYLHAFVGTRTRTRTRTRNTKHETHTETITGLEPNYRKYVRAGNLWMPYCLASRLSLIFTKSTPNESVSSSIFSSSASTLSQVTQLRASVFVRFEVGGRNGGVEEMARWMNFNEWMCGTLVDVACSTRNSDNCISDEKHVYGQNTVPEIDTLTMCAIQCVQVRFCVCVFLRTVCVQFSAWATIQTGPVIATLSNLDYGE